ncbi:polynucleotide phosphorylase/polyadenylase [Candidatus Promineifilum breve]|uniref:Polyribonucleotide nucleotidyltransferase n=1 Tax=Candidatus Promineifilum breve TaxID=1806508 RepID=A0A160SYK3_9CHLR|nr:polyribonucleotide nucleotidyltransferase [Candidatus Promineifilum breve]CUS02042.2 polynucleotide phosphorylase/polyadenylase [Candidatus Promineifilum breve]
MKSDTVFTTQVGRHALTIATGKLAEQAGGAVTLQVGESLLLATATMSKNVREGLDFFPLSVDFEEKMYAAGRIPGGFFRREGKPTTEAVLTSRLTDRPLRPLFPDGMRNEVQVIVTTLSSDSIHLLDIMSVNAASAALTISDVPWNGPIGAVRVGYIDGEFVADPTVLEMANSSLDLRLAGTRDQIIMIEAAANEIPEEVMIDALAFGHQALQPIITLLEEMRAAVGKEKREPTMAVVDTAVVDLAKSRIGNRVAEVIAATTEREDRNEALDVLRDEIVTGIVAENETADPKLVREVFADAIKKAVRRRILDEGIRPDGRDFSSLRELGAEVGISPRAHGSGLFQRGQTQVLSIVALGTPREAQKLDGLSPEDSRRYMHHYNFPPFSTGETWPMRGPRRREIGHGALAENALLPMIPSEAEFPYTIRVVSEVLSSNGSTSQASVCASSLALMDCGVPIKRPVAGISVGLISDEAKSVLLTDIQGLEDHLGDMDFKVAGTTEGITAIQLDIKVQGLDLDILAQSLHQARGARMEILDAMLKAIAAPRAELSLYAPRMLTIKIDPEKIGAVIGKGGATIRGLEEEFEVSVDVQEDGTIFVAGVDGLKAEAALERIHMLTHDPDLGEIFTGRVVRITDFGAFVELAPGQDGMVHISQLASEHLQRVEDAVQMGDEVMVMVTDVSGEGKIRLSRRAVLEGWTLEEARAQDAVRKGSGGPRGGNGGRGGDRGGDRRGGGGDRGGRPQRR